MAGAGAAVSIGAQPASVGSSEGVTEPSSVSSVQPPAPGFGSPCTAAGAGAGGGGDRRWGCRGDAGPGCDLIRGELSVVEDIQGGKLRERAAKAHESARGAGKVKGGAGGS